VIQYDPHDWSEHLFDLEGSMVREIGTRVASDTVWAGIVVLLYYAKLPVSFPSTGHTLVGLALGLLLVFRTNASYDRFWEGRKLWGGIVNETRNLARQAVVYLRADPALASQVIRWTSALAWAIRHSMHGRPELGPIASQLPVDEVQTITAQQHVPLAVATKLTALLVEARRRDLIDTRVMLAMDQNIQLLVDYFGACERIKNTPLPFAYVVHLRRALILYSITLPLALVKDFGWGTVPATFCVAYTFFGIEEIGVEIENPFGDDANDLPLDRICENIQNNLDALDKTLA
jgi:putative membrane protein